MTLQRRILPWLGGVGLAMLVVAATIAPAMYGSSVLRGDALEEALPLPVVRRSLQHNPLAWEPILARGAYAANGQDHLDRRLIEAAIRRNPRAIPPRLAMISWAAQAPDLALLARQLAILNRITPGEARALTRRLATEALSAGALPMVVRAFASAPDVLADALHALDDPRVTPVEVRAVIGAIPSRDLAPAEVRQAAIAALVRVHDHAAARRLAGPPRGDPYVDDADLTRLDRPPPFGWELTANDAGVAEPVAEGGVSVTGYGRTDGAVMTQLLTLPPGRYRLAIGYGPASESSGILSVAVHCVIDDRLLTRMDLPGGVRRRILAGQIDVPLRACTAQNLRLEAHASDVARDQSVRIDHVSIQPL